MNTEKTPWLHRSIHPAFPAITNEIALFAGLILVAIFTRFYDLESRVMSHDESLHTYFSWLLYRGQGYQHTPMMHGPYQFHIIALTYFIFGVSDFTARIPAVLFSLATVWMVWYWRRYLGNWGMIIATLLMVISPYMLYYGRYVRNESFVGFSGILLLYAMLRYMENGEKKYLYMVTLGTVLHFTSKETAFIYTAQALIFLGIYYLARVTRVPWAGQEQRYRQFIILLLAGFLLASLGAGTLYYNKVSAEASSAELESAVPVDTLSSPLAEETGTPLSEKIEYGAIALGGLSIAVAAGLYIYLAYVKNEIPQERSFDLLLLLFTFVLPALCAFVLELLDKLLVPLGYLDVPITIPSEAGTVSRLFENYVTLFGITMREVVVVGILLVILYAISIYLGQVWSRDWWKYGALYWGIFIILYTTVFTNPTGFFTGVIGSLGYWLVQQGVERGSQPEYYYVLVQIPMYEFLPAIGMLVGIGLGLKKLFGRSQAELESEAGAEPSPTPEATPMFGLFFGLITFWSITSIVAFTIAGERMPWLTYHMAWPMILLTGWAVGQIIESVIEKLESDESTVWKHIFSILMVTVFALSIFNIMRSLYGPNPPFQGTDILQLQATAALFLPLVVAVVSGWVLFTLMQNDILSMGLVTLFVLAIVTLGSGVINGAYVMADNTDPLMLGSYKTKFIMAVVAFFVSLVGLWIFARQPRRSAFVGLITLVAFGLLGVQTLRTSFRANYINYDRATEYLVYAHGAGDIKEVMAQVQELSERTTGGLNAVVAYDASAPDTGVSWPLVWYLRDYTATRSFDQPTRSLREATAVIVDQSNFDKIEPALGDDFYRLDYIRMWWPNQDYFNLDQSRVLNAITNTEIRSGIFDIWLNRDYTRYAQATGSSTMTLTTWQPANLMRLYVRKDAAAKIWNYGVGPTNAPTASDPYEAGPVILTTDAIFGSERYPPLGLNAPRSIAYGINVDLYIADSRNHRILHIASDGSLVHEWGTYADGSTGEPPLGSFNEPWGVAVGPDGSVYVTDTWNNRVQKFTGSGEPIKAWGRFGQPNPEDPLSKEYFWGPRGIAVDDQGRVYVADTGNKRIVVFDEDGNYLTEFGGSGFDPGQFDEPVGVAVATDGTVYVTDTWNQRVQSFIPSDGFEGLIFAPLNQWDVNGWFGQSLDNKPFITVGGNGNVYITDPEGYRVLEFTATGEFVRSWGDFEQIGLAAGVAIDPLGSVWVTDAGNNRILRFKLP